MLVLGHTGITLGIAVLAGSAFSSRYSPASKRDRERHQPGQSTEVSSSRTIPATQRLSRLTFLASKIDIRILLIGSLLSDIIDKPIGHFIFRETFSNGRIISHTLLFLILITLAGLYLYKSRARTGLLVLSFGTLTHLIFDQMWHAPRTLFWPIYGFAFDRGDITDWIPNMLAGLISNPQVYVPELVGAAVLLWFAVVLVRNRKVFYFLKWGRLP